MMPLFLLTGELEKDLVKSLQDNKPKYGKKVVAEVSKRLEQEYGSGFDNTSISRTIKFYQEIPDFEKVATLSQQLTWSHFVEILPMQDELKRDFYVAMCMQERRIKILFYF